MKLCMEWTYKSSTSSERGGRVTLVSKARHVIDHFAPKVKLHFDDIFVSTTSC
jgi:hypothetical protein